MECTDTEAPTSSVESEEAWKCFLPHVDVVERLRSCSLVSSTLCRAATAAKCTTLKTSLRSKHAQSFMDWIRTYGGQLSVLDITGCDYNVAKVGFAAAALPAAAAAGGDRLPTCVRPLTVPAAATAGSTKCPCPWKLTMHFLCFEIGCRVHHNTSSSFACIHRPYPALPEERQNQHKYRLLS